MPAVVSVLIRRATYSRWLHLSVGGVFAGICVMVVPGFSDSLPRTLLACLISPLPILACAALVPGMRHAEGVQARWLLAPEEDDEIGVEPSRTFSDRCRTGLWLVTRVWLGVVVLTGTVHVLALAVELATLPTRTGLVRIAGVVVADGVVRLLYPLLAPPLVLLLVWTIAAAGLLQLTVARALLGPSQAERLAEFEQRAEALLERNRLAAELHDSIGHALTLTVLQAGAARSVASTDPGFVDRALAVIEETGRRAMDDLERTVGILREAPHESRDRPTLAEVDQLLESAQTAGTPVVADLTSQLDDVPKVVSREAYRILQEALTNALRHAPGTRVTVKVSVDDDRLELSVTNPLPVQNAPHRSGKGLQGIRERAILLGGEVTAEARSGRWVLQGTLPLRSNR